MKQTFEKGNTLYRILGDPIGDYTILIRSTSFQPYVVAWRFSPEEYEDIPPVKVKEACWDQGHYFQDYISALTYAITKTEPTAILSAAITICDEIRKVNEDVGFGIGDQLLDVINYFKEDEED